MPIQLLEASAPLTASLVIASFGTSEGYDQSAFDLKIDLDPSSPLPSQAAPLRYGKLPEIHHIFKSDPKNPPRIISLVFTLAVLLAFPALLITVRHDRPLLKFKLMGLCSGCLWAQILITSHMLYEARLWLTLHSSGRFWPWRLCFSCITPRGPCSRPFRLPSELGL